jgi:hypothetical protein
MIEDNSYFDKLSPRQQLNDLVHKYAQKHGCNYGDAWRRFDQEWKSRHGVTASMLRWRHNRKYQKSLTIPAFLEETGGISDALIIGREM